MSDTAKPARPPSAPPCAPPVDDQGFTPPIDPNPGACPNPVVENTAEIEDGKPGPAETP